MRNPVRIMIALLFAAMLSGCYQALPPDQDVQMSTWTLQVFTIVSSTTHDFQWYMDNELLSGETGNTFKYFPTSQGDHILVASFKDWVFPTYHTWYVHVH